MKREISSTKVSKVQILKSVYNDIRSTIGSRPAESGGLLFGNEEDMIVRAFVFDKNAKTTRSTYSFNTGYLNPEIKRIWKEQGLSCLGFIHSHPYGCGCPSHPDIMYFSSTFDNMPRPYYITPIIFTDPDGGFQFNPFVIYNGTKEALKVELEILPDSFCDSKGKSVMSMPETKATQEEYREEKEIINNIIIRI